MELDFNSWKQELRENEKKKGGPNLPSVQDTAECRLDARVRAQRRSGVGETGTEQVREVDWTLQGRAWRAYLSEVDPGVSCFLILWLLGHWV